MKQDIQRLSHGDGGSVNCKRIAQVGGARRAMAILLLKRFHKVISVVFILRWFPVTGCQLLTPYVLHWGTKAEAFVRQ